MIKVADDAFKNNTSVTNIIVSDSVTEIGKNAFAGAKKLTAITIGKNVKYIRANAFTGCKSVKTIIVKTQKLTAKTVAAKAFGGFSKKAVIKTPKKSSSAYKKLFKKKGFKGKVKTV